MSERERRLLEALEPLVRSGYDLKEEPDSSGIRMVSWPVGDRQCGAPSFTFGDLRRAAKAFQDSPTSETAEIPLRMGFVIKGDHVEITHSQAAALCPRLHARCQQTAKELEDEINELKKAQAGEFPTCKQSLQVAPPPDGGVTEEICERADTAILGIGHLLSHLPDNDSGWSEMSNDDLLAIYAVYVAKLMKRDPGDPTGLIFDHLLSESTITKEGT